jgi:hypothetical protein
MEKKAHAVLAGLLLSLASLGPSQARDRDIDDDVKARNGTVRCGGSNHLRQGGSEIHFTSYNLRNVSSTTPITIERLTFFDANGSVLFDSNTSGFPPFSNAVLGPSDNVLDPNQTAQLDSTDVLPFLPENQRPIQLEVVWSAAERVLILEAGQVRIGRQRDPVTGAQGQDRTRHSGGCRTIRLSR